MGYKKVYWLCLLFLASIGIVLPLENAIGIDANADPGRMVFKEYCAVCHGVKGEAQGDVVFVRSREKSGRVVDTYPRDFTLGVFKFRSTSTGCLPTDGDLLNTVTNSIEKSFMPTFKDMSLQERKALVGYIKTFSTRWKEEDPCKSIAVKRPKWVGSPASVENGKQVYKDMKCWECHGEEGKGDGPKSDKLKDDLGRPIVPFDFTTGKLKRRTTPENIYITFTTGLDGSGMPSYEDSMKEEDRWHLVSYTLKLMKMVK